MGANGPLRRYWIPEDSLTVMGNIFGFPRLFIGRGASEGAPMGLSDKERVNFVRPKQNLIKNREKKRHKKSKRSNIKYFLTIYFLIQTTQKCTNFVDTLLVLHLNYILLVFQISTV